MSIALILALLLLAALVIDGTRRRGESRDRPANPLRQLGPRPVDASIPAATF
jgi:hypothetical protein